MSLTFDRDTHTYRLDGEPIVNVTRITDALAPYIGIPESILARKAEIGDAVHYATELFDQGALEWESVPEEVIGYVRAWEKFRKESGFEPEHIEARVLSRRYRYAGTLDRTGRFQNLKGVKPRERVILDIKATYKLLPAVGPQTAAYGQGARESLDYDAARRFAARLKRDGTYELEELRDPADFPVFQSALNLYYWRQRHGVKTQ